MTQHTRLQVLLHIALKQYEQCNTYSHVNDGKSAMLAPAPGLCGYILLKLAVLDHRLLAVEEWW